MTDNSCWLVCSVELKFSAPSSVAASLSYPTLHQIINSGIAAELSGLFLREGVKKKKIKKVEFSTF